MTYRIAARPKPARSNTVHCIRRRRANLGSATPMSPRGDTRKPEEGSIDPASWQTLHRWAGGPGHKPSDPPSWPDDWRCDDWLRRMFAKNAPDQRQVITRAVTDVGSLMARAALDAPQ